MTPKSMTIAALVAAGLVVSGGVGIAASTLSSDALEAVTIHGATAVDVENPAGVMRHAEQVVVADVADVVEVDEAAAMTTFRVSVNENVKGAEDGELLVTQHGIRTDEHHYELEGQPLLEEGKRYLLALNSDREAFVVIGGPESVRPIGSPEEQRQVVAEYRRHAS